MHACAFLVLEYDDSVNRLVKVQIIAQPSNLSGQVW